MAVKVKRKQIFNDVARPAQPFPHVVNADCPWLSTTSTSSTAPVRPRPLRLTSSYGDQRRHTSADDVNNALLVPRISRKAHLLPRISGHARSLYSLSSRP